MIKQLVFFYIHQATSVDKYWAWVEAKLIPQLYGGSWYNGDFDESLQRYTGDKVSFILGYAIIRQLRIKRGKYIGLCQKMISIVICVHNAKVFK